MPKYVTTPNELLPPEVTIDTDAQLLNSPQVASAIADTLDIDPVGVEQRVSVTASANTHVLHVTVTSGSRTRAADAANAAAAAFIDVRRDTLGALSDSQVNQVRIMLAGQEELLNSTQSRRLVITGDRRALRQRAQPAQRARRARKGPRAARRGHRPGGPSEAC